MKNILKRIIGALVFLSIVISILMYAGIIGRPYLQGSYKYDIWQYFYQEDKNTHNVINIGSSAIYRYWAPLQAYEEQGITSFTLGSTMQPFNTVPYIMEEALKTQNPDLFVVEVRSLLNERIYELQNSEDGSPDKRSWVLGVIASGMNYSPTRYKLIHENYVDTEGDCELFWHIPVLKYHSLEYKLPLSLRLKRIFPSKDPLKSTYLIGEIEKIEEVKVEKELYGEYYLTEKEKSKLDHVVKTARDSGVEILLVSTPYILDKEHASMHKSLDDYIAEKNYPYIDFNDYKDKIGLNSETDYYNALHTNVVGAKKFTEYFAKFLADNYEFDNVSLTEKQVKEWDACIENWAQKYEILIGQWERNREKTNESEN